MSAPEDGLIVGRVQVTKWIREDGREWWDLDYDQDQSLGQIIGLLNMAAYELYRRAIQDDPEVD